MKEMLEAIGGLLYEIFLWFALVIAFFIGVFLMGITLGFLSNVFMAGFRLL
jgi:uncharacterized membrane protein (DUF106 family)